MTELNLQDWQDELRNDPRPTADLISLALTSADDEVAWKPVQVLHHRANREVLEASQGLSTSACPAERELAANILGQLGVPDRVFPDEVIGVLLEMLEREQDEAVLSAISVALGHQHTIRAVEPLTGLRHHPSGLVRWSVAYGLAGLEDERAIAALIDLTEDPDGDVRDWATFALGSQLELDTTAIREALIGRLNDPHDDTRGEALVGLARRGDPRVVEPLLRELTADLVRVYAVEAAGLLRDPRLYPALSSIQNRGPHGTYFDRVLAEAVARCKPLYARNTIRRRHPRADELGNGHTG
jgi:HEAT repeat protein